MITYDENGFAMITVSKKDSNGISIKCSTLDMPVAVYRSWVKYYWVSKMIIIFTYDINGEQIADLQGPYTLELHRKIISFCNDLSELINFPDISAETPDNFHPYFPETYTIWKEMFGDTTEF